MGGKEGGGGGDRCAAALGASGRRERICPECACVYERGRLAAFRWIASETRLVRDEMLGLENDLAAVGGLGNGPYLELQSTLFRMQEHSHL